MYYVPGNHESYGVNNVQETLANFEAQFGKPFRAFDHKGTRFILLASSLGTLRAPLEQLPFFKQQLETVEDPREERDGLRPPPGQRSALHQVEPARRP